jgi:hypothetical protein
MTLDEIKLHAVHTAHEAFWDAVNSLDDLTAMGKAIEAYEAAMVRPIADAPRNEAILTFDPHAGVCAWCEDQIDDETAHWRIDRDSQATHFRPLPPVPSDVG